MITNSVQFQQICRATQTHQRGNVAGSAVVGQDYRLANLTSAELLRAVVVNLKISGDTLANQDIILSPSAATLKLIHPSGPKLAVEGYPVLTDDVTVPLTDSEGLDVPTCDGFECVAVMVSGTTDATAISVYVGADEQSIIISPDAAETQIAASYLLARTPRTSEEITIQITAGETEIGVTFIYIRDEEELSS